MQELEKILEEIGKLKEMYKESSFSLINKGNLPCEYDKSDIEAAKVQALSQAANIIRKHMNDGWIPVKERLPEEKLNKVSYLVTVNFGFGADVRILIFTDGHWWCGPKILDQYVIAWRPFPEPYQEGRVD